jgi:hypothetical protein
MLYVVRDLLPKRPEVTNRLQWLRPGAVGRGQAPPPPGTGCLATHPGGTSSPHKKKTALPLGSGPADAGLFRRLDGRAVSSTAHTGGTPCPCHLFPCLPFASLVSPRQPGPLLPGVQSAAIEGRCHTRPLPVVPQSGAVTTLRGHA